MLIPERHPLASVNDSFNAVFVHGDAVDDAMFYGRGAGELPTASAVVGDIFDIARNLQYECCGRISCTCYKQLPIGCPGSRNRRVRRPQSQHRADHPEKEDWRAGGDRSHHRKSKRTPRKRFPESL